MMNVFCNTSFPKGDLGSFHPIHALSSQYDQITKTLLLFYFFLINFELFTKSMNLKHMIKLINRLFVITLFVCF